MAARNGCHAVVKALVDGNLGTISMTYKEGQTALHMAVKGKSTYVVEKLVNADPFILNIHDRMGNTTLHLTPKNGDHWFIFCF
jgi:ankyrin repeat protein